MSFTIKCNKCGNEAEWTESIHEFYKYVYWKTDNDSLDYNGSPGESLIICKKCNNSILQDT